MTSTRTQERGICIYCGKEHAVQDDRMVAHGYTVEFHQQNGNCSGVGRVHYGHVEAPAEIERGIAAMRQSAKDLQLSVAIKEREIEQLRALPIGQQDHQHTSILRSERFQLSVLKKSLASMPFQIEHMEKLLANWKEKPTRLVDLEVEEAEQRKARQSAAEAKKVEKAIKDQEKAQKAAEREAKAAAKWEKILSENIHQVEYNGEVLVEWVASYASRDEMEKDSSARCVKWFEDKGITDPTDRISMAWGFVYRVRENTPKKKQIHKW